MTVVSHQLSAISSQSSVPAVPGTSEAKELITEIDNWQLKTEDLRGARLSRWPSARVIVQITAVRAIRATAEPFRERRNPGA
jgi:hypothetical protein